MIKIWGIGMIFETHAHYDDQQFDEDRDSVIRAVHQSGVHPMINVGASIASVDTTLHLAHQYDFVYAAVGVHPDEVEGLNETTFAWLAQQTKDVKTVAVGEIGLDYHWHKEPEHQSLQRKWFAEQIHLAKQAQLPVIIHSREAAEDTMCVMKQNHAEEITGVIHCYSYSKELAQEFIQMGYYIGVGGVVTFKNARKLVETVEAIPLERILLETDCPYMAPEPYRGTRNDSRNIPYVIQKIAEIRGISTDEVERITEENAYRLFAKVIH
jgi:TatD DNase family protein